MFRVRRALFAGLLIAALFSLLQCRRPPAERLKVATTIFPLYDLTRRIAGPDADVVLLVPSEEQVETYDLPRDAREAAKSARLFVFVGLGLDDRFEELVKAAPSKARLLKVGDRVPTLPQGEGDVPGTPDPYVWLDPQRARLCAKAVAEEMARTDGAHATAYRQRASALDASLAALDTELERRMSALTKRTLGSTARRLAYYGERYKLEIFTLPPLLGAETPSAELLGSIAAAAKARNCAAVVGFARKPGGADRIAEAAKLPVAIVDVMGGREEHSSYEKTLSAVASSLENVLR